MALALARRLRWALAFEVLGSEGRLAEEEGLVNQAG